MGTFFMKIFYKIQFEKVKVYVIFGFIRMKRESGKNNICREFNEIEKV